MLFICCIFHTACRAGYYRSDSDPQTMCKRCPANTVMDVVAAPMCQCLTGYFRNTEGLEDECPADQIKETATDGCSSKQLFHVIICLFYEEYVVKLY